MVMFELAGVNFTAPGSLIDCMFRVQHTKHTPCFSDDLHYIKLLSWYYPISFCAFVRVYGTIRGHCSFIQLPDLIKPSVSAWKQWMLRRASKRISREHYLLRLFYVSHIKHIAHCPNVCFVLDDWNYLHNIKGRLVWYTQTQKPPSNLFLGNKATAGTISTHQPVQKTYTSFCTCPNNSQRKRMLI